MHYLKPLKHFSENDISVKVTGKCNFIKTARRELYGVQVKRENGKLASWRGCWNGDLLALSLVKLEHSDAAVVLELKSPGSVMGSAT